MAYDFRTRRRILMHSSPRPLRVAAIIAATLAFFVGTASTALATSISVTGITPITGHVGTSVVLTGTGFLGTTSVMFTGESSLVTATFAVTTDTQITTTSPDGA